MGAVVVTICGVLPPTSIMTVVSLAAEVVVEVSAEVEEHGVSGVDSAGDLRGGLHIGHLGLDSLDSRDRLHIGGGWHNGVVTLGSGHGINKLGCDELRISIGRGRRRSGSHQDRSNQQPHLGLLSWAESPC